MRVSNYYAANMLVRTSRPRLAQILRGIYAALYNESGPGSVVGIATGYGLDGPGIESPWGRDFPHLSAPAGAHQVSCTTGTGSFPGVKSGRGVTLKG
jgi:hypothetical protein